MRRIVLSALLLAAAAALAQAPPASAPPMHEAGGVKYLSGGIGEEERQQMQVQAEHFPLQIVFSGKGGEYVVADSVSVLNRQGPVLTVRSAGPLLMLNLPPGAYVVKASFGTMTQERAVSASAGPQKIQWSAPAVPGS